MRVSRDLCSGRRAGDADDRELAVSPRRREQHALRLDTAELPRLEVREHDDATAHELSGLGVTVKDTAQGTDWEWKGVRATERG